MSKEPIRLTREEALLHFKRHAEKVPALSKNYLWCAQNGIKAAYEHAEREAEFDPKDVQVGDEIEFRVVGERGHFKATVLFRAEYTLLIENCLGRRVIGTYDVTRIVHRPEGRE